MEAFISSLGVKIMCKLSSSAVFDSQPTLHILVLVHVLKIVHVEVFYFNLGHRWGVCAPRNYGKMDGVAL